MDTASFERIISNLPPGGVPAIPLLRSFAAPPGELLAKRLERRFRRLCFVQEELAHLKAHENPPAAGSVSFEDFVFANMDFSRYAKISEDDYDFFVSGLEDFDEDFFQKNFRRSKQDAEKTVRESYTKKDAFYCLAKAGPLILSIMRTMETSLETLPLAAEREVRSELETLYAYLNRGLPGRGAGLQAFTNIGPFFQFLLARLDGLCFCQKNGTKTKLYLGPDSSLVGTFMPQGKPWTVTLVR